MNNLNNIFTLIKRLAFVLLLFVIMRNLMYIFNVGMFHHLSLWELVELNFYGLRFDISAIMATNSLLLILYLIPFDFTNTKWYSKLLNSLFLTTNIINIVANLSDVIYYRFTLKRTTFEFIHMFQEDSGMFNIISSFIFDFWYISILGVALIIALVVFSIKTSLVIEDNPKKCSFSIKYFAISIFLLALSVLGTRGGFQLRPISIIDANKYTNSENQALVLNTSFTIIKTFGKQRVEIKHYFPHEKLEKLISVDHIPNDTLNFRQLNVVVIIMESLSKEHSAYFNKDIQGKGFTPFLDSLCDQSMVCTQAYANGRKSIEGIPAILASFPTLFNDAFISSNYSANRINSLASLLKNQAYSSSFFHGGNNGTMGFSNFMASIGFDNYYGRNEYNNEMDFDGKWGIFDHKFFSFFEEELSKKPEPFFASIFSLSAHHPYTIPKEFEGKFPKGKGEIQQSIAYSDYALQQFFEKAKNTSWFSNTLFVITADHTSEVTDENYNNEGGKYAIPILYYMPSDSLIGNFDKTTQQIDILPSILDYLNYPESFYSLGNSIFTESKYRESISYNNGIYQYISGNDILQFNPSNDSIILHTTLNKVLNAKGDTITNKQQRIKSFIQEFNFDLVNDKMRGGNWLIRN
ncbi:MAG: sulfatase-like hydrolase/transferase [Bacteroidales bacterium]|nr:sulfatase-like hydrolase/transferase [Bacteroidales bacterium]